MPKVELAELMVNIGSDGVSETLFRYDSDELQRAAEKQAAYHREREAYWSGEADRLEVEVRTSGVELREQQVTGGAQFHAVIDADLGKQLSDARTKRDYHRAKARRFEAYAGAFGHANTTYLLTIDEVDQFALHREAGD